MTRPRPRLPRLTLIAAALLGLSLGACGGTLYDPAMIPVVTTGGLVCTAPARACDNACKAQGLDACGPSCAACPAAPTGGTETCEQGSGGVYGCVATCSPGFLTCPSGCCRATAVAAGGNHACAITSDASLVCWGSNDAGQLGPAATGSSSTRPVEVLPDGVSQVALGGHHSCALRAGAVTCWGANDKGQLGNGATGAGGSTPVAVSLAGVTELTAGARHTCAVAGGAVKCWGANDQGQLGTGSTSPASVNVPTASLVAASASAVASLTDTTCAVVGAGVSCWGANGSGQVGNGGTVTPQATPQALSFPTGATSPALQIFAGGDHACALLPSDGGKINGGLFCWGSNLDGQLGNNTTSATPSSSPIRANKIDNGGNAFAAATGAAHSCAGRDPTNLVCAGLNDQAQAGAPAGAPQVESPVSLGGNLVSATAGLNHTCALADLTPAAASTLVVKCWGRNAEGQLGRDTAGAPSASADLVGQ